MGYDVDYREGEWIVRERGKKYAVDLRKRLLQFSVDVIRFLMALPERKEWDVLRYQLSRSATAIGANYEEAQSASAKEFTQKTRIALREANESKYWLSICQELQIGPSAVREHLIQEITEISRILGAIVSKMAQKNETISK